MAIYTKLDKGEVISIISNYNLGNMKNYKGIKEGIENTNYLVETDKGKFILTIYEKRVNKYDLPFFSKLMLELSNKKFICPKPILNKNNEYISDLGSKKFMLVSYLEGKSKTNLSPDDCSSIGEQAARLHEITKNFNFNRNNDLSVKSWRKIFDQVKDKCNSIHPDLPKLIEINLKDVEEGWPENLPKGIIHGDLFHDNIFFKNDNFSGFIDFYFSCNDFYAFEIAICFNALCFDGINENLSFNVTKAKKFFDGYNQVRKVSGEEKNYIKVLSQGAALRFLLTRVFDSINKVDDAVVKIKDPIEYLKRLEFHKNSKNFEDYVI